MKETSHGLTLIELVVVLVILAGLAGLLVPLVDGLEVNGKSPEQIATETTLGRLRDVIMGTPTRPGVWADVGQRPEFFPRQIQDLVSEAVPDSMETLGLRRYDPITRIGWRGPYLVQASGQDDFGNPALRDGWGRLIDLQIDFNQDGFVNSDEARYARLVSAGEDGVFNITLDPNDMIPRSDARANELTLAESGDDVVLFLRVPDTRQ